MLGGGIFITQNKKLPGSYINFVNASKVGATVGERGVAAIAMELDWGKDNEIMTITQSDFNKNMSITFPNMNNWNAHVGSMLYIDDISLVYDK